MTTTITERDKKLLLGLLVFCVAALLTILVIWPIFQANRSLKQTLDDNAARITQMQEKESQLPVIQEQNTEMKNQLAAAQADLYPMLKTQDVDKLLTEKVLSHGLSARKLQITMPDASANITGYGLENDPGSNADGGDGIWIADATLETSGSDDAMDRLIDDFSMNTPGVRVVKIDWSSDRRTVDDTSGLTEQYGVLTLQLQVLMSRKD